MKMVKVVRVEMKEIVQEYVRKSKRHDYVRGGYKVEETITRRTTVLPYAILECGHYVMQSSDSSDVRKAKKLSCWRCEDAEYEALHYAHSEHGDDEAQK